MAYLTKTQVEKILAEAPPGTTPGGVVSALRKQGHQLEGYAEQNRPDPNAVDPEERGLLEKAVYALGNFTGVTALGKGIAAGINKNRNQGILEQGNKQTDQSRNSLIKAIQKNRTEGKDTSRLENALAQLEEGGRIFNADMRDMADLGVSNRDVIGSAVRTAGTIASFGSYGAGAAGAQTGARLRNVAGGAKAVTATSVGRGILQGAKAGAKVGAKSGSIFGGLQSLGLGIQDEEKGVGAVAAQTAGGVVAGGITGGIFGTLIGGATGGYQARQNFKAELDKLVPESNTPYVKNIQQASKEVAEELGDGEEVRLLQARNSIKASEALPIDDAIKAGDITPDQIYSDPTNKILQPDFAKGRVLDVRLKLNAVQPGLGDDFAAGIDVNATTYDDIVSAGLNKLDEIQTTVEKGGKASAAAAPYKVDPKTGKIVSDVDAKTLMRTTGLPADDIAVMKSGTKADKAKFKEMLEVAQGGADDPLARVTKRPETVAGKTALDRIKAIRGIQDDAGAGIDRAVRTELASKKLNTQPVYQKWVESLAEEGIDVLDDGTIKVTPDSRFYKVPGAEKVLKDAQLRAVRLNGATTPASRANTVKNQLDELLDFGNNQDTGLSGAASRLAKGLRHNTDELLDNTYPAYNKANQRYAITKTALGDIESVLGKNYAKEIGLGEASDELVAQRLGTLLRRLHSQAPESAVRLVNALDETAFKLDLPVNESVTTQSYFATIVNNLYPENTPRNSLAGQVQLGTEGAGRFKAIRNFAQSPIGNTVNAALDVVEGDPSIKQAALEKYIEQLLLK